VPDSTAHLAVARRNQLLIDRLLTDPAAHPEWLAVVAFYKALHVVEAVLFRTHPARHGLDHPTRNQLLKARRYQHLYKNYRPLYTASLVARYLESSESGEVGAFAEYMSAERVRDYLVNHCLRQVERSAENLIGPLTPPASPPPT
jgi:hypothetical protein